LSHAPGFTRSIELPHLIEIAFKGNRKEFFLWDFPELPLLRAAIIVDADRGEDLGRVNSVGDTAKLRCEKCSHGLGTALPARHALRLATREDVRREAELRAQDEDTRRRAMALARSHGLEMKLSDAEWQWDGRKLTFYFTSEKRVDFRKLVRDMASAFRARIELKQIGVRDEAKRLDGIGRCGRQYCSASWLPELRPVNLGVAKDQRLSLNPSQISGACGRLMCSLRYEHEFYVKSRKRFPKEGKIIIASRGEEKIISNDIFRDRVSLRNVEGDTRIVDLLELREEMEAARLTPAGGTAVRGDADTELASNEGESTVAEEPVPAWARLSGRQLPLAHGAVLADEAMILEDEVVVIPEVHTDGGEADAGADAMSEAAEDLRADAVPGADGVSSGGDRVKPRRRRGRRGHRKGGGGRGGGGGGGGGGSSPGPGGSGGSAGGGGGGGGA
jgi:cell fate regulator YaaT (PSP1 superfamily)